jgi:hypothetical protein
MYSSKEPFGIVPQLDSLSSPPGNGAQWRVTSNGSENGSSLPNSSPPPQQLRAPQQQQQQQRQQQQHQQQRDMLPSVTAAAAAMKSSSSVTSGNNGLTGTITGTSTSTANNSVVSRARLAAGRTDEQCKQLNLYCGASRTANLLRRNSHLNLNPGVNSATAKSISKAALIGHKRGSSSTTTPVAAQNDSSDELQQQQQELHLNTAVPFSAVVLGAEGSGCAHTVQVLIQAFVNTSSTLHTANSSSSGSTAAAVQDVSSIKGKASVLVLHYGGHVGGTGVSPYAKMATDSMAQQQQVKSTFISTLL